MKALLLVSFLCMGAMTSGCKSEILGEFVSKGASSTLRLFEENSGTLFDVKNGPVKLEVDTASLNPLADTLVLRLRSSGNTYRVRIDKNRIHTDGSFELSESELEQPIRISGRIGGTNGPVNLLSLVQSEESLKIEIQVFEGFSSSPESIGTFTTRIESQILKDSDVLRKNVSL
jgi:hypothetical protein